MPDENPLAFRALVENHCNRPAIEIRQIDRSILNNSGYNRAVFKIFFSRSFHPDNARIARTFLVKPEATHCRIERHVVVDLPRASSARDAEKVYTKAETAARSQSVENIVEKVSRPSDKV